MGRSWLERMSIRVSVSDPVPPASAASAAPAANAFRSDAGRVGIRAMREDWKDSAKAAWELAACRWAEDAFNGNPGVRGASGQEATCSTGGGAGRHRSAASFHQRKTARTAYNFYIETACRCHAEVYLTLLLPWRIHWVKAGTAGKYST